METFDVLNRIITTAAVSSFIVFAITIIASMFDIYKYNKKCYFIEILKCEIESGYLMFISRATLYFCFCAWFVIGIFCILYGE